MTTIKFNALNYRYEEVRDLSVRDINAAFRAADESHLWPICGKFNATERAIRRLQRFFRASQCCCPGGYEYCLALEREISSIVNTVN